MKKWMSLLLVCLMALSLCGCQRTEIPATNLPGPDRITEENLVSKLQGWWVGKIADYTGYLFQFEGDNFVDGIYPGSYGIPGQVTDVIQLSENKFEAKIHFPEAAVYEDPIPAYDASFFFEFNGESEKVVTVTNGEGEVYQCYYAGLTEEDRLVKCKEVTGY